MTSDKAMVALCRECRGMHAATVMDDDRPQEWSREVARWARWESRPLIEQTTVEEVRKGNFCLANAKGEHVSAVKA